MMAQPLWLEDVTVGGAVVRVGFTRGRGTRVQIRPA